MLYMVSDDQREVPVRMDMGIQPTHNISVWNNHWLQQKPFHHPRLSATFSLPLCGCILLPCLRLFIFHIFSQYIYFTHTGVVCQMP